MTKNRFNFNNDVMFALVELIRRDKISSSDSFYNKLFELLLQVFEYQYASIFLYRAKRNKIQLVAQKGQAVDLIEKVSFELGKGFSAWVAQEKKPVLLQDLKGEKSDGRSRFRSFLAIPILLENELVGVINFGHKKAHAFNEELIPIINTISTLIASLLSQKNYEEEIEDQYKSIRLLNQKLLMTQQELISMREKQAIAATIVSLNHEINNPLMIIDGSVQLLLDINDNPMINKRLNVIQEQTKRITDIIKQLQEIEQPRFENYINNSEEKVLKFGNDEE